jgi:signal transduction histidine kinase/CheY-like chemotaxis protein
MILWNLGFYAIYNTDNLQTALFYNHYLIFGTMFIFAATYNFTLYFTNLITRLNKFLLYLAYALSFLFIFMHFKLNILSSSLTRYYWGFYPNAGIGDLLYGMTFLAYGAYSQVIIYKMMKTSVGQKRNQYRFVFWGTIFGFSMAITNFLPAFGISIYPIGNLTSILYSLAVAYALVTVKMINLQFLLRKAALEILTVLTILIMCAAVVYPVAGFSLLDGRFIVVFALIILLTMVSTHYFYDKTRNMYFSIMFKYHQIFRRDIQIWNKEIRSLLTKKDLFEELMHMTIKMFMVEKCLITVTENEDIVTATEERKNFGRVQVGTVHGDIGTREDMFLVYAKENNDILIRDDLERKLDIGKPLSGKEKLLFEEMAIRMFSMLIPLKTNDNMVGYLLIGNTLSGNMFDKDELDALLLIKDSIEVSLRNIENINTIQTQESRIEEELQKANKLESLGILAGGIAHDFNNLLTIIMGNISLAKVSIEKNCEMHEILSEAEKSARKAVGLAGQLSTFSKGGSPIKRVVSISDQLRDLSVFASRGSKVKCKFYIQDRLWLVDVDETQFTRVINNIVINATQAMPLGGELEISAENMVLVPENNLMKRKGNYVMITIKDHGLGIPKEHLNKIFDPYFTTKETGTGLGLAIVYSIITKHGGYVDVKSEVGLGTTFQLYFPASDEQTLFVEKETAAKIHLGKGKILVMDDDISIQLMLKRILVALGYEVIYCSNGIEAIEIVKDAKMSNAPFDLAIMDLTVQGGLGGKAAVSMIKQIDPGIKAVVSSGYSNDDVLADPKKYDFDGIMAKPYTIEEMSKVLSKVLTIPPRNIP